MFKNNFKIINKKRVTTNIKIIAEAAQGYEGDVTLAKLLVRAAASSGADIIKFQIVFADEITRFDHKHYKLFKDLELKDSQWLEITREANKLNIEICFDIFGPNSLRIAKLCKAKTVKIHASDFFNTDLISSSLKLFQTVLISIGGAKLTEIDEFFLKYSSQINKIIFLYGYQSEPTSINKNNLSRLNFLTKKFPNFKFGFMDHTSGILKESRWISALSIPYSIKVIEKHISLDLDLKIEDYMSALSPNNFKNFVDNIRSAENFLGKPKYNLTNEEYLYRKKAFKVVVAKVSIKKGTVITKNHLILIRVPDIFNNNLILRLEEVIGKKTLKSVKKLEPFKFNFIN